MKYCILIFFASLTFFGIAQKNDLRLFGKISETSGEAIPYATVLVYKSSDSTMIGGASSDSLGLFSVPIEKGSYYVKIRFLSFQEKIIPNVLVAKQALDLGNIVLTVLQTELGQVNVTVEKPLMELKLDKRIFNVTKDISTVGLNAADILDNIPSVSVDAEGNVSLRGNGNVRLLINGKPSPMTNSNALRQINGSMIESVEVITNPSARYDAEGEVGIINIILKTEMQKGFNASLNARIGYPFGYGAGVNMNFKHKKINYFANYGFGKQYSPGSGNNMQRFSSPDTSYRYDQVSTHSRGGFSHNINVGFDYQIRKQLSLQLNAVFRVSNGDNNSSITYSDYDLLNQLTQRVQRDELELDYGFNQDYNLNLRKTFAQKDRLWTFDAKKSFAIDNETSDLNEWSTDPADAAIYQRTTNNETEDSWLFQTDYIHPIGPEGKFEAGSKASLRKLTNDYLLEDSLGGQWNPNALFNNFMVYTENIYAAYLMYGNKTKKISYQAGIRAEYSDISTDLTETNQLNRRRYLKWFPSLHLSYEINKKNSLQLSYSRRISRPTSWWLTPFYTFKDSRNYESGNPNINPDFTGSYELGHLKYWDKGSVLSTLYYRHTENRMDRILLTDSTGLTWRIPVNLGYGNSYGFEFTTSYAPYKWWNMNANFNFFKNQTRGEYLNVVYANDAYAWTTKFTTKFTIKRKLSIQSSFTYESPSSTNQGSAKAQYFWDGSLACDVLKGKGTLSFNARDILNSRKRRSVVESQYFYSESSFQWRSRQLTLSFVYRINQKEPKKEMDMDKGDN